MSHELPGKFRTDVEGLRGFAILLVILFHLFPGQCSLGFMGVDIFLVISGYFLIGKQLDARASFTPLSFLQSKVLRIFPPVLALVAAAELASLWVFPADDMLKVARLTPAVLAGYANQFLNAGTTGYFSEDTRLYPLMHLWYIGVLVQSYLLFGGVFFLWQRLGASRKLRIFSLVLIAAVSFLLFYPSAFSLRCGYGSSYYYCTGTRLWEFALGGLAAAIPAGRLSFNFKTLAVMLAAGLAAAAVKFGFGFQSVFGLQAQRLFITLGALFGCLAVYAGYTGICGRVLGNPVLRAVGKVSFSLYLVHWPWICMAEYLTCRDMNTAAYLAVILGTVLSGWILFRLVEQRRFPLAAIAGLWLLGGGLWGTITLADGFRTLWHQEANALLATVPTLEKIPADSPYFRATEGIDSNQWGNDAEPHHLLRRIGNGSGEPNFAVIGDSHATDFADGMHLLSSEHGWNGILLDSYILPFDGTIFPNSNERRLAPGMFCDDAKRASMLHWLQEHRSIRHVFIVQYWASRFIPHELNNGVFISAPAHIEMQRAAQLRRLCLQLRAIGKEVILVTDGPFITSKSPLSLMRCRLAHPALHQSNIPTVLTCTREAYEEKNRVSLRVLSALEQEQLCQVVHREQSCFADGVFYAIRGKECLMRDADHFYGNGSAYLLQAVKEQIHSLLNRPDTPLP